jgi:hypothetical protein
MRVFLSAFSGFTLAVPMSAVAAMMLYDKKTEKLIHYDQKERSTYISLPRLFNLNEEDVHHGIILREWNSTANKVVLLTAEIKRDIEIPDKEFHPIPKSLGALRFSKIFNGIKFSDNPVLLLDIEQMTQLIQEEQYVINTKNNYTEPPLSEEPEQPLSEEPPPKEPPPPVTSEPSPPPPELESQIEQPPSEEPPPIAAPEPSPPPPEPESQIEQSTQIIQEDQQVRNEIEPLPDQLLLEDLPSEEPPEELLVEEPLSEELLVEEPPPEELLVEEPLSEELLVEEPPSTAASGIEPLTELLVLSEAPL